MIRTGHGQSLTVSGDGGNVRLSPRRGQHSLILAGEFRYLDCSAIGRRSRGAVTRAKPDICKGLQMWATGYVGQRFIPIDVTNA
jgi:hypothetical protein